MRDRSRLGLRSRGPHEQIPPAPVRELGRRRAARLPGSGTCPCPYRETAGPYTLEIGWQHEPTYVGETNGVQVIVTDANEDPVTDLGEDDLKVVVSTGSDQSGELTFEPAFDLEEGDGPMGQYNAPIMPTAPGDYTFHITGNIHGQPVDVTVTSGDETFDTVQGTAEIQFPVKIPTMPEVVTRLDRARCADRDPVGALERPDPDVRRRGSQAAADAAARRPAPCCSGSGSGSSRTLIGVAALIVAVRAGRRPPA